MQTFFFPCLKKTVVTGDVNLGPYAFVASTLLSHIPSQNGIAFILVIALFTMGFFASDLEKALSEEHSGKEPDSPPQSSLQAS